MNAAPAMLIAGALFIPSFSNTCTPSAYSARISAPVLIQSLYLLLQFIKHRRAEELTQGHIQAVAEPLDQVDRNLFAARVKHTIHAGGRDAAAGSKFVGTHVALAQDSLKRVATASLTVISYHL